MGHYRADMYDSEEEFENRHNPGKVSRVEHDATKEAMKRYPDEVAKALSGVRHGFIEGAKWQAAQASKKHN